MTRGSRRPYLISLAAAALAAGVLALACRGTVPPPKYVFDPNASFSNFSTFAWYPDPTFQMPHGDSIIDGQFIDSHVRSAVDASMQRKGYEKTASSDASMFVAYHTGDTGVAEQDKFGNYEWATGYVLATVNEKERNITIDIRDHLRKLIWRGSITRLEGQSPEAAGRELDHEIHVLLGHFPPSTGK